MEIVNTLTTVFLLRKTTQLCQLLVIKTIFLELSGGISRRLALAHGMNGSQFAGGFYKRY
jgi:hypothetical protein